MNAITHRNIVHLGGPGSGAGQRIYLLAPLAGTVFCYGELARHLCEGAADLSVYGVQAVGLHGQREPLRRVEAMARASADAIETLPGFGGELALAGWSFGALVALETTLRLRQQGRAVSLLALLDNLALTPDAGELDSAGAAALLAHDLGRARHVDLGLCREELLPLESFARAAKIRRRARAAGISPGEVDDLLRVYEASARARRMYTRKAAFTPCGGRVLALNSAASSGQGTRADPTLGWGARITGELEVVQVPGDHHSMLQEPHVRDTAARLAAALRAPGDP